MRMKVYRGAAGAPAGERLGNVELREVEPCFFNWFYFHCLSTVRGICKKKKTCLKELEKRGASFSVELSH